MTQTSPLPSNTILHSIDFHKKPLVISLLTLRIPIPLLLVIITIPILLHVVVILYTVLHVLGSIVIAVLTFLLVAIWSVIVIIILVTIIIILPSTVAPFVPAGITILPAIIPTANGLGIPSIATLPLVS